uniref:Uncharacterized protein n=1 Tax=Streptococcus mitis TaxID=28037 RepID=A0A059V7Y3_STRMT|nr:hypothetical protein Tn6227_orf6 [Streptococcus mitis]
MSSFKSAIMLMNVINPISNRKVADFIYPYNYIKFSYAAKK